MKFNTLTFDANLPTTQQVNVPTNTDYKVGMKVKRNGEIQQLGPDEFTIYTGEMVKEPDVTIGPAEISSLQKSITVAYPARFGTQFAATDYDGTDLTAYYGKEVPASGCKLEYSVDNGTTWTEFYMPSALGTAAFATNRNYPGTDGEETWFLEEGGKWKVKDGGLDKGYVESFVLPEAGAKHGGKYSFLVKTKQGQTSTPLSSIFGGHVPSASNPVLTRATITFSGEEIPITIPTDAEKTNGYVTFTQASNDDASFRQLKVEIEHGYNYNDTYTVKGQFGSTKPDPNPSIVAKTAGELGLAGVEIHASDYERISSRYWRDTTPAPEDINEWGTANLWTGQATDILKLALTPAGSAKYRSVYHSLIDYTIPDDDTVAPEFAGFTFKTGEYYFVESDLVGA